MPRRIGFPLARLALLVCIVALTMGPASPTECRADDAPAVTDEPDRPESDAATPETVEPDAVVIEPAKPRRGATRGLPPSVPDPPDSVENRVPDPDELDVKDGGTP